MIKPQVRKEVWSPLLFISLVGWTALLATGHWFAGRGFCGAAGYIPGWDWQGLELLFLINPPGRMAVAWLLMLLAMMPPLLAQPVAHLWYGGPARRRLRSVALFGVAYLAVWMLSGLILMTMAIALQAMAGVAWWSGPAALAGAVALVWHVTPVKQGSLNRCHCRPPLSGIGWAADRDCLRYGLTVGVSCVGACWALMLVPLVVDRAHLAFMAAVSLLLLAERQAPVRPAAWRPPGTATPRPR